MDLKKNKLLMLYYKNNQLTKDDFISEIVESMYFFKKEQEENPISDGYWMFERKDVEDVISFLNKKHNKDIDVKSDDFWFGGFVEDYEIMRVFNIDEYSLFEAFANIIIDNEIYTY